MNLQFTKPNVAFSQNLTSDEMQNKFEVSEKQIYENGKQHIQKSVLKTFKNMKWQFHLTDISFSNISKLKEKIIKRGLACEYKASVYCPSGIGESGEFTKPSLTISLPENSSAEEDDGYFSDGWDKGFKASVIRKEIQQILNKEYLELGNKIETTIKNFPGHS